MWFEAMSPMPSKRVGSSIFSVGLLRGDRGTINLLRTNPFPDAPPRYVRAQYYRYRFTTPEQRRKTGLWWDRQLVGTFYGPVSRSSEGVR